MNSFIDLNTQPILQAQENRGERSKKRPLIIFSRAIIAATLFLRTLDTILRRKTHRTYF